MASIGVAPPSQDQGGFAPSRSLAISDGSATVVFFVCGGGELGLQLRFWLRLESILS